jgi:hypothetical protein
MSARKKPPAKKAARASRYARPELKPETLKDLKMLGFLIGEVPPPKGSEDAWLWEQARTVTGKPMHRLLLAVSKAAMNEDAYLKIAPGQNGLLESFAKARAEVFKAICDRALKRGDAVFFKHLAECIEVVTEPREKRPVEQFKAAVLQAYTKARIEAAMRATTPNPKQTLGDTFGAMMQITAPDWQDIREQMENQGTLPKDFLERDVDDQKRQIEKAAKSLGLPYAKKSQGS